MNFFERQHAARGTTVRLVLLFTAAVLATIILIDAVVLFFVRDQPTSSVIGLLVGVTAIVVLIMLGGTVSKTIALRQGGSVVARAVGATPVDPSTSDPQLRRFINIVEEMSIASGVPVPRLFVMAQEPGINAFAAGHTPSDAAITVTAGALQQLNRDELQGVIGHEFSHVLNGDMRLNIRLIGLLNGLLLLGLIGLRVLSFGGGGRAGGDKKGGGAPIVVIALAMFVLGFVGQFFAGLIKAAVSRQREWLADASAVQFTRQTTGLEGALKKIAGVPTGSALKDTRSAAEVSHMLFGEGKRSFSSLYATHPPLAERIAALDPSFRPEQIKELQQSYHGVPPNGLAEDAALGLAPQQSRPAGPITTSAAGVSARVSTLSREDLEHAAALSAQIPDRFRQLASQETTGGLLLLAMVLDRDPAVQAAQLQTVAQRLSPDAAQTTTALAEQVRQLDPILRLPLVSIALPQLTAGLSVPTDALLGVMNELALTDGSVSLFEYCLMRVVWTYVQDVADPSHRGRAGTATLAKEAQRVITLLATLAAAGNPEPAAAQGALDAALQHALPGTTAPAQAPIDTWRALDAGWPALDALEPRQKQLLVEAMVVAAMHDNQLTVEEAELLRAACMALHLPMPGLIA